MACVDEGAVEHRSPGWVCPPDMGKPEKPKQTLGNLFHQQGRLTSG